jgi:c-di-GMP-binding flagellar brake protein YcgR
MTDHAPELGEDTNFSLLPVLRHYENKRRYPRVDVRVPVLITTAAHDVLKARMRNLSAEGMQIRCDAETAKTLHPKGTQIVPGAGAKVMVRFVIEVRGAPMAIAAQAQLRYITAKKAGEIAFGLQFLRLNLEAKKHLLEFFMDCMRPER